MLRSTFSEHTLTSSRCGDEERLGRIWFLFMQNVSLLIIHRIGIQDINTKLLKCYAESVVSLCMPGTRLIDAR
jgi:hypothetical protein